MQTKPFDLQDYPFKDARKLVFRRNIPGWQRTINLMAAGLFIGTILASLFRIASPYVSDHDLITTIGATWAIVLWLSIFTAVRQNSALKRHPLYAGCPSVFLSDDAVIYSSPEARLSVTWGAIKDVVETKSGLVILVMGFSFIPVPTAAFNDTAEMSAFAEAIRARILVAKEPFQ